MGVHKANDLMIFGREMTAQELEACGLVSRIFPTSSFHRDVQEHLRQQVEVNVGKSRVEVTRLMNASAGNSRLFAIMTSLDALPERIVDGDAYTRFADQRRKIKAKAQSRSKL